MATGNLQPELKRRRRKRASESPQASSSISSKIDTRSFREIANELLRCELNPFQLKLNSNLLDHLAAEFLEWIEKQQIEIDAQLKTVPADAKQRWLKDRLSTDSRQPQNQPLRFLSDFLFQSIQNQLDELQRFVIITTINLLRKMWAILAFLMSWRIMLWQKHCYNMWRMKE